MYDEALGAEGDEAAYTAFSHAGSDRQVECLDNMRGNARLSLAEVQVLAAEND